LRWCAATAFGPRRGSLSHRDSARARRRRARRSARRPAQARWLFSSPSPSRSQGRRKERQRGRRASQPSSPRESTAAEGDRRPPNAAAGPIARAPPRQRERPPPCARRSRRKRRRTAGVRRLRSASPADRRPGASPWPAPSTASGRAIDSVRPRHRQRQAAPQWRQALASCLTIRSGSATRLSVSPFVAGLAAARLAGRFAQARWLPQALARRRLRTRRTVEAKTALQIGVLRPQGGVLTLKLRHPTLKRLDPALKPVGRRARRGR
jgi:hypothetical protein